MKQPYFVLAFFCVLMFGKAQAQEDTCYLEFVTPDALLKSK